MNIKLLDKNFNMLGELDNFYSLIWHRKYFDAGAFELVCRPEAILLNTKYLYRADAQETGRVDRIESQRTEDGEMLFTVSGRFLEGILYDRIIYPTFYSYSPTYGSYVIADLIRRNITNPVHAERRIDGHTVSPIAPQTKKVDALQVTYDNLAEYIYELCMDVGCSVRAQYDFLNDQTVWSVWEGKDRTFDQTANSPAIFADSFDNLMSLDYYNDVENYKNFAYVAGEGEGSARQVVTLSRIASGEDRKELYVDARDLQSKSEDNTDIPAATYQNMLLQRGREKLSEWGKIETVDCEVASMNKSLIYKQDYDLGDVCTVRDDNIGIIADKRITECVETYENNAFTLSVTFGEDILNFWRVSVHK